MNESARLSSFALLLLLAGIQPLHGQTLEEGTWTGAMATPSGRIFNTSFDVSYQGDSLTISVDWKHGSSNAYGAEVSGDYLSFSWTPSFKVDCLLVRQERGSYQGACRDVWGGYGPILMGPERLSLTDDDLDSKEALQVWEVVEEQNKELEVESTDVPSGETYDIGGYSLNLVAMGEGTIPVVLEAGLGDNHRTWMEVQRRVADVARVVAYDRAGLGYSDPSPAPRTPDQIATELHTLLQKASIEPPYVLVGHAEGSFFVRSFAAQYPDDVAGLVLVSPSHEEQGKRWKALSAASWETYMSGQERILRSASEAAHAEFSAVARILDEGELAGAEALPDVPLVVLTSMRPVEDPKWVGETEEGRQVQYELHQALARQVSGGTHVVTEESGRYIQVEKPGLVVDAIRQVLEAVEGGP